MLGDVVNYRVPNPGGRLYPASVCLQMVLAARGDGYQIYELENVSGHPYGWFYVNQLIDGQGTEMELSPGTELTNSLLVAARTLGYDHEHCSTADWDRMWGFLTHNLTQRQPVIFGPIAYNHLTYQIGAMRATAMANHYIVLVALKNGELLFHDPNGMSYIPMSPSSLRDACTPEVVVPGTPRYSAVKLGERRRVPAAREILGMVLAQAVSGYQERRIRGHGYLGLVCLAKYADHITEWMGAKTPRDRETVMRKLGLFFYPKSNQMRSDAITFMQNAKPQFAAADRALVDEFCGIFAEACARYQRGAQLITPRLIDFDEGDMGSILDELSRDALVLHRLESQALEVIKSLRAAYERNA